MNKTEYLLTCLSEECAEVQQAVAKVLRFGLTDCAPGTTTTNEAHLVREILDVVSLVEIIVAPDLLNELNDSNLSAELVSKKIKKVVKYMEYSRERGCLDEEN